MNCSSADLDELVLAMAHWLEAAHSQQVDPAGSSRELAEAARRLAAHQRAVGVSDNAPPAEPSVSHQAPRSSADER